MADIAAVEQAKENIFPLKRGRDAAVVLRDDNQYSEEQQQQKLKFEQALSSPGADHLGAYHVYAKWWQQNLGSCGGAGRSKDKKQQITQEGLVALLEEALKKFLTDDATEMYRRDYRYLGLWLMYGENALRSSTDMFAFLWARQIGVAFGLFYMAWAAQLERDRRFEDCDDCYKMGIARKAEPLQKLQEDYERFQMRMVERVRRDLDDKDAAAGPSSSSAAAFGGGGPSSSSSFANASTSSSSGKRTAFNVLTSADAGGMARPTWDQRGILGSQPGAVGNAGWGKMGSSSSSGRENWDPFDDGGPGGGAERKNLFDSESDWKELPFPGCGLESHAAFRGENVRKKVMNWDEMSTLKQAKQLSHQPAARPRVFGGAAAAPLAGMHAASSSSSSALQQGLGMQQPQPAQESSFEMFCDDEFQDCEDGKMDEKLKKPAAAAAPAAPTKPKRQAVGTVDATTSTEQRPPGAAAAGASSMLSKDSVLLLGSARPEGQGAWPSSSSIRDPSALSSNSAALPPGSAFLNEMSGLVEHSAPLPVHHAQGKAHFVCQFLPSDVCIEEVRAERWRKEQNIKNPSRASPSAPSVASAVQPSATAASSSSASSASASARASTARQQRASKASAAMNVTGLVELKSIMKNSSSRPVVSVTGNNKRPCSHTPPTPSGAAPSASSASSAALLTATAAVAQPMTGVVEETTLGVGRFTKQVKRMFGGGDDGNTTGLLPTRSQLLGAARGRAGSGSGTATGKTDKNGEEENEDELTFATKRALKEVGGLFGDREDTTGVVVQPNPKRPKKLLRAHSSVIGAPTTLPDASHSQPAGFVSRSVSGERSRLLKPQISVPATSTSVVFEPSARQTLQDQNRRVEHDPMSMSQGDVNPHSQEISGPLRRHGSGGSASAQLPDRMMRARTPSNEKRKPPGGVNNPPGSHSKPLPRSRGASPSISLNNSIHFREAADIHIHRGNYDENEAPPDPALAATMADLRGDNSVNVGGVNIPSAAIGGNLAAGGSSGSSSSSSANNSYQASANAGNFGPPGMSNTAGGGAPSSSGSGAAAGSSSSSYTNLNNQPISQGASGRIISGVSPRNPRAGGLLFGNRNTLPYFGPSGRSNSNNSRNAGGATANANENSRSQQEFISAALRRDNSGSRGRSRSNKPVQDMSQVTKAEFEIFDEMASPKAASRVSSKGSGGRLSVMIQSSPSDRSGALQNEMLNRSAARKSQHGGLVFESTPGQRSRSAAYRERRGTADGRMSMSAGRRSRNSRMSVLVPPGGVGLAGGAPSAPARREREFSVLEKARLFDGPSGGPRGGSERADRRSAVFDSP
mmetsp:Transcript_20814/g.52453  ORF Transcript_20814/g.52453 Transcript_20814/m.52453 type:complete len:1318 (-) Transcript_20814:311-4264(-)